MSDHENAVVVKDLFKSFKLPHENNNGVKQAIVNFTSRKKGYEIQHVLNNISFEIKKGEFFGIVGRNGSGKSTLLKLLAGIYTPDKGLVQINGSLTPFIELGVGFNPELTGRENVYMNGALLGFSNKQMDAMYDDIVNFAELERFMDQKLKNYSSGMQVRLAFSIAIKAESDILLIDEVLAVGDSAFQKKCFDYFVQLKRDNRTVILVTHDMSAVEKFCDRALIINKGELLGIYKPNEAASIYDELNQESLNTQQKKKDSNPKGRWGNEMVVIDKITVNNGKTNIKQGQNLKIRLDLSTKNKGTKVVVGLAFYDQFGVNMAGPNSEDYKFTAPGVLEYETENLRFNPGEYTIVAGVFSEDYSQVYDYMTKAEKFNVISENRQLHGKYNLIGTWEKV